VKNKILVPLFNILSIICIESNAGNIKHADKVITLETANRMAPILGREKIPTHARLSVTEPIKTGVDKAHLTMDHYFSNANLPIILKSTTYPLIETSANTADKPSTSKNYTGDFDHPIYTVYYGTQSKRIDHTFDHETGKVEHDHQCNQATCPYKNQ